jgi:hypothetical protein
MQRRPRAGVAVAAPALPATRKIDDLMWFEPDGSSGPGNRGKQTAV